MDEVETWKPKLEYEKQKGKGLRKRMFIDSVILLEKKGYVKGKIVFSTKLVMHGKNNWCTNHIQ